MISTTVASVLSSALNNTPVVNGVYNSLTSRVPDASAQLYAVLKQHLAVEKISPVTAHDASGYPDCTYSRSSSDAVLFEAIEVAHIVRFFVVLRHTSYDDLVILEHEISQSIEKSAGMNVIDSADGVYEEETKVYLVALEIEISYPLGVSNDDTRKSITALRPQSKASNTPYDAVCHSQLVDDTYSLILVSEKQDQLTDLTRQVQAALLGRTLAGCDLPLRYVDGRVLNVGGGLFATAERYVSTYRIKKQGN